MKHRYASEYIKQILFNRRVSEIYDPDCGCWVCVVFRKLSHTTLPPKN